MKGAYAWDVDGNKYVDYVGSWGPAIVGHADDEVLKVLSEVAAKGTSFGAPSTYENVLAKMVIEAVPSVEMVRFTNSGTSPPLFHPVEGLHVLFIIAPINSSRHRIDELPAVLMCRYRGLHGHAPPGPCLHQEGEGASPVPPPPLLLLSPPLTPLPLLNPQVIKFDGCYHGHADGFLVQAGSGVATLGLPDSPGVPQGSTAGTLVAEYNNLANVEALLKEHQVAAVILEPVVGNSGFIKPSKEFLVVRAPTPSERSTIQLSLSLGVYCACPRADSCAR